jgi:hypothetical protein
MNILVTGGIAAIAVSAIVLAQSDNREVSIGDIDRIDAKGNYQLYFEPGDRASLRIAGDADDMDDLEIDIDNGELRLNQRGGIRRWFGGYRDLDITIYVTGPQVDSFAFARGLDADVSGLAGGDYTINLSTGSEGNFSGRCDFANINISTGAELDGRNFECSNVRVNASTGSDMVINAIESLTANASTGANVRSLTAPVDVRLNTSTGGDVDIDRSDRRERADRHEGRAERREQRNEERHRDRQVLQDN